MNATWMFCASWIENPVLMSWLQHSVVMFLSAKNSTVLCMSILLVAIKNSYLSLLLSATVSKQTWVPFVGHNPLLSHRLFVKGHKLIWRSNPTLFLSSHSHAFYLSRTNAWAHTQRRIWSNGSFWHSCLWLQALEHNSACWFGLTRFLPLSLESDYMQYHTSPVHISNYKPDWIVIYIDFKESAGSLLV